VTRALPTLFAAALAQGVSLVTYPAAGNLLRDAGGYGLSSSEYGALFLPMIAAAVASSSGAEAIARRIVLGRLLVVGLAANAVAQLLLVVSWGFAGRGAFALLLAGEAALGLGFGATLTAMNTWVPRLVPERRAAALTALHAVVGIGTALPPLGLRAAAALGAWWLLPAVAAALLGGLALSAAALERRRSTEDRTRLTENRSAARADGAEAFPARLWAFAGAAALYGFCEAIAADWSVLFLHEERGLSAEAAGLALSAFWGALTGGRLLFAATARLVPARARYVLLPIALGAAYVSAASASTTAGAIAALAAVGLGCSAFFPLTVDLGTGAAPRRAAGAAGLLMASFMAGNGAGGFGVGVLHDHAMVSLRALFAVAPAVAAALAALAFAVTAVQPTPAPEETPC
jgi:fucose permease